MEKERYTIYTYGLGTFLMPKWLQRSMPENSFKWHMHEDFFKYLHARIFRQKTQKHTACSIYGMSNTVFVFMEFQAFDHLGQAFPTSSLESPVSACSWRTARHQRYQLARYGAIYACVYQDVKTPLNKNHCFIFRVLYSSVQSLLYLFKLEWC